VYLLLMIQSLEEILQLGHKIARNDDSAGDHAQQRSGGGLSRENAAALSPSPQKPQATRRTGDKLGVSADDQQAHHTHPTNRRDDTRHNARTPATGSGPVVASSKAQAAGQSAPTATNGSSRQKAPNASMQVAIAVRKGIVVPGFMPNVGLGGKSKKAFGHPV
jgi:hypothetical protein